MKTKKKWHLPKSPVFKANRLVGLRQPWQGEGAVVETMVVLLLGQIELSGFEIKLKGELGFDKLRSVIWGYPILKKQTKQVIGFVNFVKRI